MCMKLFWIDFLFTRSHCGRSLVWSMLIQGSWKAAVCCSVAHILFFQPCRVVSSSSVTLPWLLCGFRFSRPFSCWKHSTQITMFTESVLTVKVVKLNSGVADGIGAAVPHNWLAPVLWNPMLGLKPPFYHFDWSQWQMYCYFCLVCHLKLLFENEVR